MYNDFVNLNIDVLYYNTDIILQILHNLIFVHHEFTLYECLPG